VPYDFSPCALVRALAGVEIVACAYWTRHDRAPVGHRDPWLSHAEAVSRSGRIIDAAGAAGVARLVWTSIANPRSRSGSLLLRGQGGGRADGRGERTLACDLTADLFLRTVRDPD